MRDLTRPTKKAGEELLEVLDEHNAEKKPKGVTIRQ